MTLVLSLFPGIDLFGEAFRREGFCVVRGPDIILGQEIQEWSTTKNNFEIIIGGPPCKAHSPASCGTSTQMDLIPQFERIILEAQPKIFVMESVKEATTPTIKNYQSVSHILDSHHYGANQTRKRKFTFGWISTGLEPCPFIIEKPLPKHLRTKNPFPTVLASEHKYPAKFTAGHKIGRRLTIKEVCELQGVPEYPHKWFLLPQGKSQRQIFRREFQFELIGNAVEMRTGLVIARTVKHALPLILPKTKGEPT